MRWALAAVVLSTACGPSIELQDDSNGSSGSAAASTGADGGGAEGPMASCRPPADAVQARLVTGRGTPTLEVLTDGSGDPEPLGCDDPMPHCNYDVHRLVPLREIVAGSFDVQAGTPDKGLYRGFWGGVARARSWGLGPRSGGGRDLRWLGDESRRAGVAVRTCATMRARR
jgi:hypothetical protein